MPAPPGMNPEIYEAISLAGEDHAMSPFSQDDPEAPIPIVDNRGQEQQMDPAALAAEGMAFAGQYMASNGPTLAMHSLEDRERGLDCNKMTKAQLREQRMNEDQGYPSNLGEAEKIKALESKLERLTALMSEKLGHPGAGVPALDHSWGRRPLVDQSSPASPASNAPTGGNPEFPDEQKIATAVLGTALPQSPHLTGLSELSEPESRQPRLRQVTLKDGRKINVPAASSPATPMSLGPATDQTQPPTQLEEPDLSDPKWNDNPDDWDDPVAVVPEPQPEALTPPLDPKLVQTQHLVQDVNDFMQGNDVHRFWRRHISGSLHRHVGYNGWPKELQNEFNNRFKGFLQDPQFVTSVCRKIISMELGHALGVKWVVSFLVATAGFTAFALCGIDG